MAGQNDAPETTSGASLLGLGLSLASLALPRRGFVALFEERGHGVRRDLDEHRTATVAGAARKVSDAHQLCPLHRGG